MVRGHGAAAGDGSASLRLTAPEDAGSIPLESADRELEGRRGLTMLTWVAGDLGGGTCDGCPVGFIGAPTARGAEAIRVSISVT